MFSMNRRVLVSITALSMIIPAMAEANCTEVRLRNERQFRCPDGTVQSVMLVQEQLIIRTFNPEDKKWSETRTPAPMGVSIDALNVSVMLNASGT